MTNEPKDEQPQGRTDFGMNTARWQRFRVALRQWNFQLKNIPKIDAFIQFISIFRC